MPVLRHTGACRPLVITLSPVTRRGRAGRVRRHSSGTLSAGARPGRAWTPCGPPSTRTRHGDSYARPFQATPVSTVSGGVSDFRRLAGCFDFVPLGTPLRANPTFAVGFALGWCLRVPAPAGRNRGPNRTSAEKQAGVAATTGCARVLPLTIHRSPGGHFTPDFARLNVSLRPV